MHILIPALHRPTKPTGVCRHAANLAQSLATKDQVEQITLIIGKWQEHYFKALLKSPMPRINLLNIDINNSSLVRNKWFIADLPKLANKLQPDVVHMSFPFPFIRDWFSTKVVVSTIHDLYVYECPHNFGYPQVYFNQLFLRQCVKNSDGLTCVSNSTLNALKQYFRNIDQKKKTAVIYNYVDFGGIVPTAPLVKDFDQNTTFFLCVAQHRKNKNLDLLIQAYASLLQSSDSDFDGNLDSNFASNSNNATRLILVGSDGPETETLHSLIESLNIRDKVIFLSSISDREMCWLYLHCQLFIMPSSTEGFCLPLVEALSLSCKVVCSDIPIFREVGSLNCTYFSLDQDPLSSLVRAINTAHSQPTADDKTINSRFSKHSVAGQLINFYASVIDDT